jgi:hypothetical protein
VKGWDDAEPAHCDEEMVKWGKIHFPLQISVVLMFKLQLKVNWPAYFVTFNVPDETENSPI